MFVELTRIFKIDATGEIKQNPYSVNPAYVMSVKPKNSLTGQRSAITLADGSEVALADKYSVTKEALESIAGSCGCTDSEDYAF